MNQQQQQTKVLRDMSYGEVGFTLPWAFRLDEDGTAWLAGDDEVWPDPDRGAILRVLKTEDGWWVDGQMHQAWNVWLPVRRHQPDHPNWLRVSRVKGDPMSFKPELL